jgi:hypothetical protein
LKIIIILSSKEQKKEREGKRRKEKEREGKRRKSLRKCLGKRVKRV